MTPPFARPSAAALEQAKGKPMPDVIAPGLDVLFCGINPSVYSVVVGHHFARPGNRFWKALHLAGLTDRLLAPEEDRALLGYGLGITNVVGRSSATAAELTALDYQGGATVLRDKLRRYEPACLAVLGIGAYRAAFDRRAELGPQPEPLEGVRVVVLPNPSGLQARYQLPELAEWFATLRPGRTRAEPQGR